MGVTPHLGRLNVMTVRPQGQLHVLVSAYACEPGKGSEPGSAWGWVWSLAQAGINVTVLSRSTGRQAIERALECHHGAGRLCFEYVDVPAAALRTHGIWRVYEHYRLWQKAAYARARCLSEAVDVVHHVSWGAILGGSELWRLGKPFVFGPAGGGQLVPWRMLPLMNQAPLGTIARQAHVTFAHCGLTRQPHVAASSTFLATNRETLMLAQRLGARHVEEFVDSGVEERFLLDEEPTCRETTSPLRVIWVGRLLPGKAAILAVNAIANTRRPVELTIVGDGPERMRVQRLVNRLRLNDRVTMTSWIPWEAMPLQYRRHDVFLFTSILDSFGSQLLEAMASGLPVVALDHQGAGSFVSREVGVLVTPTTPRQTALALANALDRLAEDSLLRAEMAVSAWRRAGQETWSSRAERMVEVYDRLLRA